MKFEIVEYKGWENCVRLSNDLIDVVVTIAVGPRVIRYGFLNGPNEFKEFEETLGLTGGDEWNSFGGHRLWHAPENDPRSYFPDNVPVEFEEIDGGAKFLQSVETTTGIQKEIELRLTDDSTRVEVLHRLTNRNVWPVELAPWCLSVMRTGGTAIVPLPPRGTHPEELLPTSSLAIWPFTHMNDPRWTWGEKYILLRQEESARTPQKVGIHASSKWAAYANDEHLFVKTFDYHAGAVYPDFNSCVELFTNEEILEVETLGPLSKLEPNASVQHNEVWHLFDGVSTPANDADVEREILPKALELLKSLSSL
jgi:hypothetical protein